MTVRVQLFRHRRFFQIYAADADDSTEYSLATSISSLSTTDMMEITLYFTGMLPVGFDVTQVAKVGVRVGSDPTTDPLTNPTVVRIDSITLSGAVAHPMTSPTTPSVMRINSDVSIAGSSIVHVRPRESPTPFTPLVYDTAGPKLQI